MQSASYHLQTVSSANTFLNFETQRKRKYQLNETVVAQFFTLRSVIFLPRDLRFGEKIH